MQQSRAYRELSNIMLLQQMALEDAQRELSVSRTNQYKIEEFVNENSELINGVGQILQTQGLEK